MNINLIKNTKKLSKILKKLKKRGPDKTNILEYNGYVFIHNILYFSGEITYQPLQDLENDLILCFNGEIYNYKQFGDYKSDTEMILEQYKKNPNFYLKGPPKDYLVKLKIKAKKISPIQIKSLRKKIANLDRDFKTGKVKFWVELRKIIVNFGYI